MVLCYDLALMNGFKFDRLETINHLLGDMPLKVWKAERGRVV